MPKGRVAQDWTGQTFSDYSPRLKPGASKLSLKTLAHALRC